MAKNSTYKSKNQLSMFDDGLLLPGIQKAKPITITEIHPRQSAPNIDKLNKSTESVRELEPTPFQTEAYNLFKSVCKYGLISLLITMILLASQIYYQNSGRMLENVYFNVLRDMKLNSFVLSGILRSLTLLSCFFSVLAFSFGFYKLWQSGEYHIRLLRFPGGPKKPRNIVILWGLITLAFVTAFMLGALYNSQKDFYILIQYYLNNYSITRDPWAINFKKFGI